MYPPTDDSWDADCRTWLLLMSKEGLRCELSTAKIHLAGGWVLASWRESLGSTPLVHQGPPGFQLCAEACLICLGLSPCLALGLTQWITNQYNWLYYYALHLYTCISIILTLQYIIIIVSHLSIFNTFISPVLNGTDWVSNWLSSLPPIKTLIVTELQHSHGFLYWTMVFYIELQCFLENKMKLA